MSDTSPNASKSAKAVADKTTRELEERLESLRADMDEIMTTLGRKAEKQAGEFKGALSGNPAEQVLEELRDLLADVKRQAGNAERKVVETARQHPLQTLLIAFGVGFLASFLLRR